MCGTEWNKQGDINQVLKVFKDFDPRLLDLVKKVDPASIKVWQLMDMDKLPSWTSGKLALLGDAAHPFTPRKAFFVLPAPCCLLYLGLTIPQTKAKVLARPLKMPPRSRLSCPEEPPPTPCPSD